MSIYSDICDYWKTDLQTNVTGLDTTTVPTDQVHLYAPWSPELMFAGAGERHLAIWPDLEAENAAPLTTDGGQMFTQTYSVAVWEDAVDSSGRLVEDATSDAAWLTLAEAIRNRFRRAAAFQSGSSSVMKTTYVGTQFQRSGQLRVLGIVFRVEVPLSPT